MPKRKNDVRVFFLKRKSAGEKLKSEFLHTIKINERCYKGANRKLRMENHFETEWTAMLRHRITYVVAMILLAVGLIPLQLHLNGLFSVILFMAGAWIGNFGVIAPEQNEFTDVHTDKKIRYFLNLGLSPDIDHNMLMHRSLMHSGLLLFGLFVFGSISNTFVIGFAFGWFLHILVDAFHPGEWAFEPISRVVALAAISAFALAAGWIIL